MTPGAYHFGNLALHALNAALVYLLAERLLALALPTAASGRRSAPARSSPPWPLPSIRCRVESVGWITDRGRRAVRDVLSLLATLAYVRFAPGRGRGARVRLPTCLARRRSPRPCYPKRSP